jgi:hypothetical protein
MKMSILATVLATGLAAQSAPTAAWYQWYKQDNLFAPVPGFWFYQNFPYYGVSSTGPLLGQTSPSFWSYQPSLYTWWTLPSSPSGTYVEQSQSPSGYHVRVHAPSGRPGNLQIGVEAGAIIIRSSDQFAAGGPLQAQQMGWFTRWITLPADANLAAMRMARSDDVVEIFVPRFR